MKKAAKDSGLFFHLERSSCAFVFGTAAISSGMHIMEGFCL